MNPADLRYTREHEWVRVQGAKAVVGITDHAQKELGDITFVDAPKPGLKVKQFGELGVIESVKAASDIFAPVSGTVSKVNEALNNTPEVVNREPYGGGWICEIDGVNAAELAALMTADQYDAYVAKP
jgi:glycine cleavage system H protein